ncbi:hypothetical protein FOL47_007955 [Perkinsus chesapeaki]|uniref:C3H1-type domain-containing protein n=1 Tax=Perkinsus chesapeaki TaxID=330153 RepID=A0A7J6LGV3_PERCH|nr:hypothetical protein FOL47_007955 [Perkinsus chesapeaki]
MVARQECRQNNLDSHGCYLYLCRCLGQGPRLKLLDHLERQLPPEVFMSNYDVMFSAAIEFLQANYATTNDHDRVSRHLSTIKMASGRVSALEYLDDLETAISMGNSVGLYLQASQVLDYFKRGLTNHLRKVSNQQHSNIRDVSALAMALQYYQEANPLPATSSTPTTTTNNSTSNAESSTSSSSVSPTRIQRIEDPELIKLCKEKKICMAYLARQSCKNGDSCPYKHTTEISRMTTITDTAFTAGVTVLNCPSCVGFTIIPDTGSTMSLVSKKLADFIMNTIPAAHLQEFHATFDTATKSKSFCCDFRLQVDLPIHDGDKVHYLSWAPAVLDTSLIHSDGLLGMDVLRSFNQEGLLLQLDEDNKMLASKFFYSLPTSTSSPPPSTQPGPPEETSPAASTVPLSTSPESATSLPAPQHNPLPTPPTSTSSTSDKKPKHKDSVDYDIKNLLPTSPTFPPLDKGLAVDHVIYSNQWCRIITIKDSSDNIEFMVDYSNELLQLALQRQPPEATKVHYRLIKAEPRVRSEAQSRFDDLLTNGKATTTPVDSINNYASPWYPVEGRKRCRPVVPSIHSNQLLRQVQRYYPIRDCQTKISRVLNKYRSARKASLLDVKDSYRSIRLGKNAQKLSQVHVRGSTLTYLYMLDGCSINAKVLEWCVKHLHG